MRQSHKRKGVLIIGTVPPPVGGVSIHVLRLIHELRRREYDFKFIEFRKRNLNYIKQFLVFLLHSRSKIVHYQLNNWCEMAVILLWKRCMGFKVIYTVHSFTQDENEMTKLRKMSFKFARRKVDIFIAPSDTIRKRLIVNGVEESRIITLNTYISPTEEEKHEKIPEELEKQMRDNRKIILASGYKLYRTEGVDIYGLDMCIEAARQLSEVAKFIFCIPLIADQGYFDQCMKRIKQYGIEDSIYIFVGKVSLTSLYNKCDLFVRPTATDSYGISVTEALDAGIPALASNVCERAVGCQLFESRNTEDFIDKIQYILLQDRHTEYVESSCVDKLVEIYEKL